MKKIMDKIKLTIERTSLNGVQWLENAKIVLMTENMVVISCRSQFAADVVRSRFDAQIRGVLLEVCGFDPEIITIDEEIYRTLQKKRALEEDRKSVYDDFLSMREDIEAIKKELDFMLSAIARAEEEYEKLGI